MDLQMLARGDRDAWTTLIASTQKEDFETDSRLVAQLLRVAPHQRWFDLAGQLIEQDDAYTMKSSPRRAFEGWFVRSALEGFDPSDRRSWPLRVHQIRNNPGADGGFAAALELAEAQEGEVPDAELAETAMLVVRGAMTSKRWDIAVEWAERAMELFSAAGATDRAHSAARSAAGALMHLGQFKRAFLLLLQPMRSRGPMFGGGGTVVMVRFDDPFEEAVGEAATIAGWATHATPEWLRALGGMAERAPDPDVADYIWSYLEESLPAAFDAWRNPESDIEVVVRHSGQRGLLETPRRVLEAYVERWPEDEWAHRQIVTITQLEHMEKLTEQLETDPETAIAGLIALLDDYESRGLLGEDNRSIRVLEVLLDHMNGQQDRRAFELQRRFYDDKIRKYGECPAAWQELQNLGTVHAEFGEYDEALELFETALAKQEAHFGPEHQALATTRRNIDRIRAMKAD